MYLIGIIIGLSMSMIIAFIPALLGNSFVGWHEEFAWWNFLYDLFFYFLIVGPVEEIVFRVYVQDTLITLLPKKKILGVIISSILFGYWHLINGSIIQVLFTFVIGLILGMCKFFIKDCKYLSVSIGHSLYDFLNCIVRLFVV